MNRLLILKSSILAEFSQSNLLVDYLVQQWLKKQPQTTLIERDLAANPLPVLDNEILAALRPVSPLTTKQEEVLQLSNHLINELQNSDTLVLAAPMYNYMVPTQLKNYFDLITRAGITFRYDKQGYEGLIKNKRAIILVTCGGLHHQMASDVMTPYLRQILAFIGITDLEFIFVEGVAMGADAAQQAQIKAKADIDQLLLCY